MVARNPTPPPPHPPTASANVVPIRPKPPAFPQLSVMARPVIIEEDVVEYLVKAPLERRWRILSRVAMATMDEPAPVAASPVAPPPPQPTVPPPPPSASRVVDHSEELFQAMQELTRLESGAAGARFCLEAALRFVPCVAGLMHLRDPATGALVVVHALGPRADGLLGTRTRADELMARAARAGKPSVVTYGAEPGAEKTMCVRHALFDPWSVALVPVMHGGLLLALFEMIDPVDGNPFDDDARSALAYVAMRLGRFLG
jgi:hypothetical protein